MTASLSEFAEPSAHYRGTPRIKREECAEGAPLKITSCSINCLLCCCARYWPCLMSFAVSDGCEQRGQIVVRIIKAAMG
ncbi:hypothetical protein, partial [Sinorhizobium meliloti]|uniref:hypothetical protein n=1 Tax=Rhizobium meliloti TaxID=382 RepID=UPI001AEF35DA